MTRLCHSFVRTCLVVLFALASPIVGLDALAQETSESGDFAGFVDIGGRSLYLTCQGEGSPTVLLEAGNDGGIDTWALRSDLAEATATRVCAYDRANVGRSDPLPLPRSGADVVADLHTLLEAADVPGPYVIASASLGGLFTRLYASTYPDDVVGMVLLDTSYEEQDARTEAMVGPELWAALEREWGTFRDAEGFFPDGFLSDTLVAELRRATQSSPLRSMPLIVVTIETPCDASCFPAGWPVEKDNALWREMQEEQAALVPGGRLVVSESNQHYLQQADPELVIESVRQVVEAVRDPSTWATPAASP